MALLSHLIKMRPCTSMVTQLPPDSKSNMATDHRRTAMQNPIEECGTGETNAYGKIPDGLIIARSILAKLLLRGNSEAYQLRVPKLTAPNFSFRYSKSGFLPGNPWHLQRLSLGTSLILFLLWCGEIESVLFGNQVTGFLGGQKRALRCNMSVPA